MKKIARLAGITAMMAIGIAAANAQTTNVILQLNIALSGFKQVDESNAAPARIGSKDIINALNALAGSPFSFGTSAKLVAVSAADGGGGPGLFVREKTGTNVVNTDVSAYLSVSGQDFEVTAKNGTKYSILTFSFNDGAGTDFTADGFSTQHRGKISARGIGTLTNKTTAVTANVSASGHVGGDVAVLKGTISAGAPKAEVSD